MKLRKEFKVEVCLKLHAKLQINCEIMLTFVVKSSLRKKRIM